MTETEPVEREELPRRAGWSGGRLTLLFVAVVIAGVAVFQLGSGPRRAEIGDPAPRFTLETFEGAQFQLGDHIEAGRGPVVLNLWASWCKPCKEEFPALSDYATAHPTVTVVGVAVQDQLDEARAFAAEMNPSFTVGFDTDGAIREAYPSFGLPSTFLIDETGTVVDVILAQLTPELLADLDFTG